MCVTEIAAFFLQFFFYCDVQSVVEIPERILYQMKAFTKRALVSTVLIEANYSELAASVILLSLELEYKVPGRQKFLPWLKENFQIETVKHLQ